MQTVKWCKDPLTLEGCHEDLQGLFFKDEWNKAVLENAFEQGKLDI